MKRVSSICSFISSFACTLFVVIGEELDDYAGDFAKIGQLPYVVYVAVGSSYCTGAIIHEEWVLSAAHCFYDPTKKEEVSPRSVKIVAGVNDFNVLTVHSKQESKAMEILIHPAYRNALISKHDVALVKLESPLTFNENVNKTYISGEEWPGNDPVKCTAAGFGHFDIKGQKNSKLKMFEVLAEHGDNSCPCLRRFHKRRLVCLKPEKDSGICRGDSGGALVCGNKTVGVAHMIMDKNTCSFKYTPKLDCGRLETVGIYMFTCPYLDWIRSSVPSVPSMPVSCKASLLSISNIMLLISISLFLCELKCL